MKNKPKQNFMNKGQEGIAVVIALGVTFLLLGLGIAFVIMSITERQISNNLQNMNLARMAAQSALNQALAQMQTTNMSSGLGGISSIDSYSDESASYVDSARTELNAQLETTINGVDYSLANYPSETSWIYIPSNDPSNSKYIARMAYVVIPDTGRLDPSASVDSGTLGFTAATESFYNGTGVDSQYIDVSSFSNIDTGRVGSQVYEIFLNTIDQNWGTYWEDLSADNATPAGKLPSGTRWNDIGTLLSNLSIDDTSTEADTIRQIFSTYDPAIPEAYWIDTDTDNIKETGELFHRFNVGRTDWSSLAISSFTSATGDVANNSDVSNATNYIPWLSNWKASGDMGSVTANMNQILANLIDYNDSDTNATTDYDTNYDIDWTPLPTYVGLEENPYINEVLLNLRTRIEVTGDAYGWHFGFSFKITGGNVELVNMYDTARNQKFSILVTGTYTANLCWPNASTVVDSSPETFSVKYTSGEITTNPSSYSVTSIPASSTLSATMDNIDQIYATITDFSISNIYVGLYDSSDTTKLQDFSIIVGSPTSISSGNLSGGYTDIVKNNNFNIDYEVKDPRQNLLSTDWTQSTTNNTTSSPYTNTVFTSNVNAAGVDPEDAGIQPWQISTAYIRNAPMKSPLELGVIHRGKAFQTLNLKKYDASVGNGYGVGAGGNVYANGDANILDQIKTTGSLSTYGKVNINSNVNAVLWPIFAKISIGSTLDTPGTFTSTGSTISTAQAQSIASTIKSNLSTPAKTRASILNNSAVSTALTAAISAVQTTDKTQEEVVGKYINLTYASPGNIFYIVAIGQALRDGGVKSQYGTLDDILATVKIFAIVKRDPLTNNFTIMRTNYDNKENIK